MNQAENDEHFKSIRYQLDALGYRQYMPSDSIGLVSQLVADLLQTTDSLKQYKNIAQNTLQVARNLEAKSTPYVRDNCSLIQECNELKTKLKQLQESETSKFCYNFYFHNKNICNLKVHILVVNIFKL